MSESTEIVTYLKSFHLAGWMPGSVGALALLVTHSKSSKNIFITPDTFDVNKLTVSDLYVLRDLYGSQAIQPPLKEGAPLSKWASSFLFLLERTNSRCVAFLPTKNSTILSRSCLKTWKERGEHPNQVRLAHWTLLSSLGCSQTTLPIIDCDAEQSYKQIESLYEIYVSEFPAIIVRNYGLISWAPDLSLLRNKVELLERIFDLQMHSV